MYLLLLQLIGLGIVGYFPQLVNYLPLRSYLTSEVSPPPINSKIQECLLDYKYEKYDEKKELIFSKTQIIKQTNMGGIGLENEENIENLAKKISGIFLIIEKLKKSENNYNIFTEDYKDLHTQVKKIKKNIIKNESNIEKLKKDLRLEDDLYMQQKINEKINKINIKIDNLKRNIPNNWIKENNKFKEILSNHNKLKLKYNKNVDSSYNELTEYIKMFREINNLERIYDKYDILLKDINNNSKTVIEEIKIFERKFNTLSNTNEIKKYLSKARKKLKKNFDKKNDALDLVRKSKLLFENEIQWRNEGKKLFLDLFIDIEKISKDNFGLRKQKKLTKEQAKFIASCRAIHKDISLNF